MKRRWNFDVTWLVAALVAGFIASTVGIAAMIALRFLDGSTTIPELVGERILPHVSYTVLLYLLHTFGKVHGTGMSLLGQWATGTVVVGILYALIVRKLGVTSGRTWLPESRAWLAAAGIWLVSWVLTVIVFWPALPANLYGYPEAQGRIITILNLGLVLGIFSVVLAMAYNAVLRPWSAASTESGGTARPGTITRRGTLIQSGTAAVAVLLFGGGVVDILIRYFLSRSASYDGMGTFAKNAPMTAITPTDQFYVVTKNVLDPSPVLEHWGLDVGGLINNPGQYGSLAAIQRLPNVIRPVTLDCISNSLTSNLISTAVWRGVLLEDVLKDRGGVKTGANRIVLHGADGYTSSLPLDTVLAHKSLLVWEMNGRPLPPHHGYPLRALIPGYYGEKSMKWIVGIELLDHVFQDFYEGQGWSSKPSETFSRIDLPKSGSTIHRSGTTLHGIAFAGIRGIKAVEVSTDGGKTWSRATVTPPLSAQTWVLWSWRWRMPSAGTHTLTVRAVDGTGATQTSAVRAPAPDGVTGWHKVPVHVA